MKPRRILLTTYGSMGDVNPFIALGKQLRAQGHTVIFSIRPRFQQYVEREGFICHTFADNVEEAMAPYAEEIFKSPSPTRSMELLVKKAFVPAIHPQVADIQRSLKETQADLLVTTTIHFSSTIAAELVGIPWVSIVLSPVQVPSAYIEPYRLPFALPSALRRMLTRQVWRIAKNTVGICADPEINQTRAAYGLPPRQAMLSDGNLSSYGIAVPVSSVFVPRPPDWPNHAQITGFCFWDTPSDWQEPPELTAFLAKGAPVIAFSSGSMSPDMPYFVEFYRISVAAIRQLGYRALAVGAPPNTFAEQQSDDLFCIPFVPYSTLFSRCALMIHHGGIGTTGQAMRAGIPTLVVPWGFDQFFNGFQAERLGVGQPLDRRKYNVESAAAALKRLLQDGSYRQRAQAVARQLQAEDGEAQLAAFIERIA